MSTSNEQGHAVDIGDGRYLVSMSVLVSSSDADTPEEAVTIAVDRVAGRSSGWMVMDRETHHTTWSDPEIAAKPSTASTQGSVAQGGGADARARDATTSVGSAAETPLACAVVAAEAATQATHLLWHAMSDEQKAEWVLSAAGTWPRHDIFLRRLLPVAPQILADEKVADTVRLPRTEDSPGGP